ncbi:MAG TPA: endonuclease III [Ktedonobacterales bacterium]
MASAEQTQAERRARAVPILATLRRDYPDAKCSLNFATPLELLVATILSAQCTDERVNLVTARLFKKYRGAQDYAGAPLEELEQDIKQTGFYRNKAKHIHAAAELIATRFGGEVPRAMADLLTLPGVARKTANVVQGNAFGIVEGVVVDTHVGRLARRMELTESEDPARVEQDLMATIPRPDWLDLSHIFIYHGRAVCQARKPLCHACHVARWCPTGAATNGTALEVPTTGA